MESETYKVSFLLGHVEIDTFFRFRDGAIIGCGRATHYDKDGNITKVTESENGRLVFE